MYHKYADLVMHQRTNTIPSPIKMSAMNAAGLSIVGNGLG